MSHFNKEAANWDKPEKVEMMKRLAERVIEKLKLHRTYDILDFGCGTGLFGLEFAPYAKSLVGVDTSEEMFGIPQKRGTLF